MNPAVAPVAVQNGDSFLFSLRRLYDRLKLDGHDIHLLAVCSDLIDKLERKDEAAQEVMSEFYWYLLDQINGVHWRDVPTVSRDAFSLISLLICRQHTSTAEKRLDVYKVLDTALLLGSDFTYDEIQRQLAELDEGLADAVESEYTPLPVFSLEAASDDSSPLTALIFQEHKNICSQIPLDYSPSLQRFYQRYLTAGSPVVMMGCVDHWPAMAGPRAWSNLRYIRHVAGHRTVPVEIGSYLSENSSQRLMLINEFIDTYILRITEPQGADNDSPGIGYVAQHRIFHQIPLLRRDIIIPDYCELLLPEDEISVRSERREEDELHPAKRLRTASGCSDLREECSEQDDILIQGWFGPVGTVSPLHHDPYHNLLTQICGYKYVRIYDPQQSQYMYEMDGRMSNNSPVDVMNVDTAKYPLFRQAQYRETVIGPGEVLFIPRHHWHWVTSVDRACACRFRQKFNVSRQSEGDLDCHVGTAGQYSSSNEPTDWPCINDDLSFSFSVNFWWGRRILKTQKTETCGRGDSR